MFRLDDMSVVEWLTTTRWELEITSADNQELMGSRDPVRMSPARRGEHDVRGARLVADRAGGGGARA